jgi:ribosomal protein L32
MSGQVTPHRQAPIDLRDVIARAADFLRTVQNMGEFNWPGATERTTARLLVDELRALLPQPAPTCPNCGHTDNDHRATPRGEVIGGVGCYFAQLIGEPECDCEISRGALPQVRALLAAERDSKPAPVKPRVWQKGDPEPESGVVVRDRDGDLWETGTERREWYDLLRWAPLTEVIPGGTR